MCITHQKTIKLRAIIGDIPVDIYQPVFSNYLQRLQRGNHLRKYSFQNKYLVALDGTQYHFSNTIHCAECLIKEKNGMTEYSHQALQPIICHPDQKTNITFNA